MCTVTWRREAGAFDVFFNRDERRSRLPALPPREQTAHGVRFLAPVDADAGGTWLAANEHGVVVGLLNVYGAENAVRPSQPVSRGLLVVSLAHLPSAQAAMDELATRDLERYPPFLLAAYDDVTALAAQWDGRALERRPLDDADRPLTTSSFDTARVLARRRERFRALTAGGVTADALDRYHRGADPMGGAYAVCMTRDDARTVSLSRVSVRRDAVAFRYEPRDDAGGFGEAITVELAR